MWNRPTITRKFYVILRNAGWDAGGGGCSSRYVRNNFKTRRQFESRLVTARCSSSYDEGGGGLSRWAKNFYCSECGSKSRNAKHSFFAIFPFATWEGGARKGRHIIKHQPDCGGGDWVKVMFSHVFLRGVDLRQAPPPTEWEDNRVEKHYIRPTSYVRGKDGCLVPRLIFFIFLHPTPRLQSFWIRYSMGSSLERYRYKNGENISTCTRHLGMENLF